MSTVLVTGGYGLAGRDTVQRLVADGHHVVATAHRNVTGLPDVVESRRVDLADAKAVHRLVSEIRPTAIVHLAAVLPPAIYRNPSAGRRVNVDGTAALVKSAERQDDPPRFIHASSGAIFGSRNPHRMTERLTLTTAPNPSEHYGAQKLEAELIVRAAQLPWLVLRLGSVFSVDPAALPFTADTLYFGAALPIDGRLHTVDTRDVAGGIAAAVHTDATDEILFIGGDDSHLIDQETIFREVSAARGIAGVPTGRRGDPASDNGWYAVGDWMDVARAQQLLDFQRYTWPQMLDELRTNMGWKYTAARLTAPAVRKVLGRRSPYRGQPGTYADVWDALRRRFGEARVDAI